MNTNTQKTNGLKVKTNVKAGTGTGQGGPVFNHNQTMAVDEPNVVADLEAANAEDIKGGPKKIFIGSLSVAPTALPDLEPQGEVKGGAGDGVRDLLIFNGKVVQR